MATICWNSIRGQAIRLTKVDACGVPIVGPKSSVISDGFISTKFTFEYEDGEETNQKNAAGRLCVRDKALDQLKWVSAEIALCGVDPDLHNMISGQDIVIDEAGNNVGVSIGDSVETFWALETWSDITGGACVGGQAWGYYLVPFFTTGKLGEVTIEEKLANFTMTANSKYGNGWGKGPYNVVLNPGVDPAPDVPGKLLTSLAADKQFHMQRTQVAPPTPLCGAQALAA